MKYLYTFMGHTAILWQMHTVCTGQIRQPVPPTCHPSPGFGTHKPLSSILSYCMYYSTVICHCPTACNIRTYYFHLTVFWYSLAPLYLLFPHQLPVLSNYFKFKQALFKFHIWIRTYSICFCVKFISLNLMTASSIHFAVDVKIPFFYG